MICPYCHSSEVVKKGLRAKKLETVQIYFCRHCAKKFTPGITKHKTFPLAVILDAVTGYNRLLSLREAAERTSQKYGLKISPQNLANWLKDFAGYLPFLRQRDFIAKKYSPAEALVESKLLHGLIYDFKYHRAKTEILLNEEWRHYKFAPLQEFLELVTAECPHQVFRESSKRASEYKGIFHLDGVKITPKDNMAIRNTRLILQAVANNKLRHKTVQQFMLTNDSVTVAAEVPVLLDGDDILHYRQTLGFDVPLEVKDGEVITGHIDIVQIRNGSIHILDYKPSAGKEKPVDQLTIYALALSRLTGLRLFHFKCAWFDEENYFEFFPLHVVYKKKKQPRLTPKRR